MIHPTAIVSNTAKIGNNVLIEAYAIVEDNVQIEDNCILKSHCILRKGAILEKNVKIDSFAIIGGEPQDMHFDINTETGVIIGENSVIREGVTIHRATKTGSSTEIGNNCFLMAFSHVGHDCKVGNHVIMANNALLAGHVKIGDYCFIGGGSEIHQYTRMGEGSILGGASAISNDVPPYVIAAERNSVSGLNLIGLKRRPFSQEIISDIKKCFHAVYDNGHNLRENAKAALDQKIAQSAQGENFLKFFLNESTKRFAQKRSKNREI